ncbi:GatB/YqeY domain-containing protein [Algiphilus sp. W345]|uniref:GatB/YqeY domain-containing protein n=1 Tax=Banduia mediterranea TaxID=3075609 RepID=A0ABU2WGQ5_9GAMM|nr:GatB/YqeY domain-containing protein [Algiphilus sp. W345]MDT0497061.1 GatB/YqeY domain-containing protein [Algiphilus sp. W345]
MSELKSRITEDMKTAMRGGDKARLGVIRMLQAAIKQREVDERIELDDAAIVAIVEKMIKQRRDSIQQFNDGGRPELAEQEAFEIEQIKDYMPQPLSEEALSAMVEQAIAETGAESAKDMGKVMGWIKPRVAGRADMGALSGRIKARLG